MILNPAALALVSGSLFMTGFALYASALGRRIIASWDLRSGSQLQLSLERKTYLVSTILSCFLFFELTSLLLFIHTADRLHSVFVGAMCAAGSLNVNAYGYPTLVLKIFNFVLCGVWLVLNHTDNKGFDYPLVRAKYKLLYFVTASLVLETIFQAHYFISARPDVITSCCGTLFSGDAKSIAGGIASLPLFPTRILFYVTSIMTLRSGIHFYMTGGAARLFSRLSTGLLFVSFLAIISFISVYIYELPTHHCPFCLLQKEYHYIGYPLYLSLLVAGVTGASVGVINRFKDIASLRQIVPTLQKQLCLVSMLGHATFAVVATQALVFSELKLG